MFGWRARLSALVFVALFQWGCGGYALHTLMIPQGACPPDAHGIHLGADPDQHYVGIWSGHDKLALFGFAYRSVLRELDMSTVESAWVVDFAAGTAQEATGPYLAQYANFYQQHRGRVQEGMGDLFGAAIKAGLTDGVNYDPYYLYVEGQGKLTVEVTNKADMFGHKFRINGKVYGPMPSLRSPPSKEAFSIFYVSSDLRYMIYDQFILDNQAENPRAAMVGLYQPSCRGLDRIIPNDRFDRVALLFRGEDGLRVQASDFDPMHHWAPPTQ